MFCIEQHLNIVKHCKTITLQMFGKSHIRTRAAPNLVFWYLFGRFLTQFEQCETIAYQTVKKWAKIA